METKETTRLEEIEERKNEIKEEVKSLDDVAKVEELEKEVDALNEESEQIVENQKEEEVTRALENNDIETKSKLVEVSNKEEIKMETRNTKEYIDAYAEYIKTGKDEEVRSLLTENVSGSIAVPDFVYDEVKTAWDKNDLLQYVRQTEIQGNLKVQFEISGSDAVVHTEGSGAVSEETLTEGIITLTPASIKKWIKCYI